MFILSTTSNRPSPLRVDAERWWAALASHMAAGQPDLPPDVLETAARELLQQCLFAQLCAERNLSVCSAANGGDHRMAVPLGGWMESPCDCLDVRVPGGAVDAVRSAVAVASSRLEAGLPVEVLGEVHQQLLGKRLKQSRRGLRAVRSGAARKAAGIYYTPGFIRDYILGQTLEIRLQELGPAAEAAELRLLDPACGCGAFLTGACRRLLVWARDRGVAAAAAWAASVLHGVDMDLEAMVIARRSLWLELAPAVQSPEEAAQVLDLLGANLQCGDMLLDERLGSPQHFDFVVGNPPYRRERNSKELFDRLAGGRLARHRAPRMDYWYFFAHRGLELLKPAGRLSFIVNSYWTAGHGAERLIAAFRKTAAIDELFLLGDARVFDGVAGRHMILTLTKGAADRTVVVKRPLPGSPSDVRASVCHGASLQLFRKTPDQLFRNGRLDLEPPADELLAKLAAGTPLGELGRVRQGIAENPAVVTAAAAARFGEPWTIGSGVFALTPAELERLDLPEAEQQCIRPYYDLCDLGRYWIANEPSLRLIYATRQTWPELEQFPRLAVHLARFRAIMEARRETRRRVRPWWHLHWPRDASLWESEKIVALQMARRPAFVPVTGPVYVPFSANVFVADHGGMHLNYFAAVLNSRLMEHWYRRHAKHRGVGLDINGRVLAGTPIRTIDFSDPVQSALHENMVRLVADLMWQNRRLQQPWPATAVERYHRQFAETNGRIDQLIYRLYGLNETEIVAIEAATADPATQFDTGSALPGGRPKSDCPP